eukprot:CAMPEP_0184312194 /NCGR_PEP_ID=MMETSP1049-20130417/47828_1 /TAXON_ID=77928 /ORGANISM="Proteomonas sulcata, Strain CCMP704" /LENGTH=58 /DNA_ID=CAMNT_0026628151 /DNA_START=36 /DNA_END=212 /DNA_ORIENTATION=-
MAKAKLRTIFVKLMSEAGTGYFYMTKKNVKKFPEKMTFRKYDPVVRQHVLFTEAKKFK